MSTNIENMEMMHFVCEREVEQLQRNLTLYLLESNRAKHFISACSSNCTDANNNNNGCGVSVNANINGFALMAYDNYMSNLEMVIDMARKFNIQLQIKTLNKALLVSGGGGGFDTPPQRSFKEFLHWNIYRDQYAKESDLNMAGRDVDCLKIVHQHVTPPASPNASMGDATCNATTSNLKLRKVHFPPTNNSLCTSLLLMKDLSDFTPDLDFIATITFVKDFEQLHFYVCEMNNSALVELSTMFHLHQLNVPPSNSQEMFGLSMSNDSIMRAVMHIDSETGAINSNKALLIDFGEVITLDVNSRIYEIPIKYQNVPVQAIKCVLLGVNHLGNNNHNYLSKMLQRNEFKRCCFRVVRNFERALEVLLLIADECIESSQSTETGRINKLNPFMFSSEEEDDYKEFQKKEILTFNEFIDSPKSKLSPRKHNVAAETTTKVDKTSAIEYVTENKLVPEDDSFLIITVTYVADVEHFYAQIENDPHQPLEALIWNDNEIPSSQHLVEAPEVHDLIIAKYNKDDLWYRAEVVEIYDGQLFKVFYVDYGNNEIVPLSGMAKCMCSQTLEPFRAVRCRFANICSITESDEMLHERALNSLCLIILNQTFAVKVLSKSSQELLIHIIDGEFSDVPKALIRMGYAKEIENEFPEETMK